MTLPALFYTVAIQWIDLIKGSYYPPSSFIFLSIHLTLLYTLHRVRIAFLCQIIIYSCYRACYTFRISFSFLFTFFSAFR